MDRPVVDEQQAKCGIYAHTGILIGHREEWNLTICDNMDGPRRCERSKPERERQILYVVT